MSCSCKSFSYTPYAVPAQQFGVHKVSILDRHGLADVTNLCASTPNCYTITLPHAGTCTSRCSSYIGMRWGSAPDGLKDHDFQCVQRFPR